MTPQPKPLSAEDWVILRLLRAMSRGGAPMYRSRTYIRALGFLTHKVGADAIVQAIAQLREEDKP